RGARGPRADGARAPVGSVLDATRGVRDGLAAAVDAPVRHAEQLHHEIHMKTPLTYGSYLRIDELLSLQTPVSEGPEHDEMLFIIVHQVYELWFKEILHELDHLRILLDANDPRVPHTLKRVLTILKVLVAQIDILETMTPLEFLSFRDRLESGSGFQSWQFRALEFALGQKRRSAVDHYPENTSGRDEL